MEVKLTAYEGPLDLLLKLIRKNEIDIFDLPISQLTSQYLEEIANLPPDMDNLSEFLVMAATLIEIKSRMLLPRPKIEGEEEGDPREALVEKLLAYSQAQELASQLQGLETIGERLTGPGDKLLLAEMKNLASARPDMNHVTIDILSELFQEMLARKANRRDIIRSGYGKMPREKFSVTEKVAFIGNILKSRGRLSMRWLFEDCRSRGEMVATFLAILEMVRRGMIHASQPKNFGDVEVTPCQA
ncbi:MAG: segregation/condensation protein A [Defluviitaleaceae bacterium]|nr:segregation/condensation protein A [Defluviitaleaceae bacterium]